MNGKLNFDSLAPYPLGHDYSMMVKIVDELPKLNATEFKQYNKKDYPDFRIKEIEEFPLKKEFENNENYNKYKFYIISVEFTNSENEIDFDNFLVAIEVKK